MVDDPSNKVKINVYEPFKSAKERKYIEYDVSYQEFDSLKEYYEYGIDNYGVGGQVKTAKQDDVSTYKDKYTEVISTTYEYTGKEFVKDDYIGIMIGFYMVYTLLIMLIGTNLFEFDDSIYWFKKSLREYNDDKKNYKELCIKLKKIIDELMLEVNKKEELKNRFNQLYEQNKYLLDNPEELMKRVNNLVNDVDPEKVKKLIEDNKLGR